MPLLFTGPLQYQALYKWVCYGENCAECASLDGEIHPLDYWEANVMPGFHPNCDCSLVAAALTENQTTRIFARVLNWMLDAGMFAKIISNAPYSSMYRIFSRMLQSGASRREEDDDDVSSIRTHRPGGSASRSGGYGPAVMGGTRRAFARAGGGQFNASSFAQPLPAVRSLNGQIVSCRCLTPRPIFPRPASIYASNRS